jgi:hypothetical protein
VSVKSLDGKTHDVQLYADVSGGLSYLHACSRVSGMQVAANKDSQNGLAVTGPR